MPYNLEIRRKIFHILFGISIILLNEHQILNLIHLSSILFVGIILSIISTKKNIPIISLFLKYFDRTSETIPGRGAITFLISILILLFFFGPINITYASIMILSFGDAFTSLVGMKLHKTQHLRKTKHPFSEVKLIEATLFGIIAASLGAIVFVSITEAIIASVVSMSLEAVEIKLYKKTIDDNLIIPIVAAITIWLIQYFYFMI